MAINKKDDFDFNDDSFLKDDDDDFSFDNLEQFDDSGPVKKAARMVFSSTKAIGSGALVGIRHALADTIGYDFDKAVDTTVEALGTVGTTFSEFMSESKKAWDTSRRIALNALPMTKKTIPERLYTGIEKFLKKDLPDLEDTQSDESREAKEQDELVASTITDVFKAAEKYQRERFLAEANDRNIDRISTKIAHQQTMRGLVSIDKRAYEISNFLRTTYTSYLKKDLELKYRSYFISKDTLRYVKAMSSVMEQKLEAIKINSGLPDAIKADANETLRGRRKSSSGGVSKYRSEFVKNMTENFKDMTVNWLKSLNSDTLPMFQGMSESVRDMSGMMAPTLADNVNSVLGQAARWGTQLFFRKYLQDKQSPLIHLLSGDFSHLGKWFQGSLQKYKDTHMNFLADLIPGFERKRTSENEAATNPEAPAQFDNLTRESIISVIPAHLERIGDCVEAAIRAAGIAVDASQQKTYSIQRRSLVTVEQKKKDINDRLYGEDTERNRRARDNESIFRANIFEKYGLSENATAEEIANNKEAQSELNELKEMMPLINRMFSQAGNKGNPHIDTDILSKFVNTGDAGSNSIYIDNLLGGHGEKERTLAAFLLKNMTRNGYLDEEQRRRIVNRAAFHSQFHDQIEQEHAAINATGDARFDDRVNYDKRGAGFVNEAADILNYADAGKAGDQQRFDPKSGEKKTTTIADQLRDEASNFRGDLGNMRRTHEYRDAAAKRFIDAAKAAGLEEEYGIPAEALLEMLEQRFHTNSIAHMSPATIRTLLNWGPYAGMSKETRKQRIIDDYNRGEYDEEGDKITPPNIFRAFDKAKAKVTDKLHDVANNTMYITKVTQVGGNKFYVSIEIGNPPRYEQHTLNTRRIYTREAFKITGKPTKKYIEAILTDLKRTNPAFGHAILKKGVDVTSDEFFTIESDSYVNNTLEDRAANSAADAAARHTTLGAVLGNGTSSSSFGALGNGPIDSIAKDVHNILLIMNGGKLPPGYDAPTGPTVPPSPVASPPITPDAGSTDAAPSSQELARIYRIPDPELRKEIIRAYRYQRQDIKWGTDQKLLASSAVDFYRGPSFGGDRRRTIWINPNGEQYGAPRNAKLLTEIAGERPDILSSDNDTFIDAEYASERKESFWKKIQKTIDRVLHHATETAEGTGASDDTVGSTTSTTGHSPTFSPLEFTGDAESLFHSDFRKFAKSLMEKLDTMGGFGGGPAGWWSTIKDMGGTAAGVVGKGLKGIGNLMGKSAVGLKDLLIGNYDDGTKGILGATKDALFGEGGTDDWGLAGKTWNAGRNFLFGNPDGSARGTVGATGDFLFGDRATGKKSIFSRVYNSGKNAIFGHEVANELGNLPLPPGATQKDGLWYDKDGNLIPGQGTHREGGLLSGSYNLASKAARSAWSATKGAVKGTKNILFGEGEGGDGLYGAAKRHMKAWKDKMHMPKSWTDWKAKLFGGTDSEGKNHENIFSRVSSAVKNFLGIEEGPKYVDIYIKDRIEIGNPLLKATDQEAGVFFVDGSGRVERSKDINKPVCNGKSGDDYRVLIKEDDIKAGLVDAEGHSIYDPKKSWLGKMTGKFGRMFHKMGSALGNKLSDWLGLDDGTDGSATTQMTFLGHRLGFTPNGMFQEKVVRYLDAIARKMGCEVDVSDIESKYHSSEKKPGLLSKLKEALLPKLGQWKDAAISGIKRLGNAIHSPVKVIKDAVLYPFTKMGSLWNRAKGSLFRGSKNPSAPTDDMLFADPEMDYALPEGVPTVKQSLWNRAKSLFHKRPAKASMSLDNTRTASDDIIFTDPELGESLAEVSVPMTRPSLWDKTKGVLSKFFGKKDKQELTPYQQKMLELMEANCAALKATQNATEKTAAETEKIADGPDKNGTLDEEGSAADQMRDIADAAAKRKAKFDKDEKGGTGGLSIDDLKKLLNGKNDKDGGILSSALNGLFGVGGLVAGGAAGLGNQLISMYGPATSSVVKGLSKGAKWLKGTKVGTKAVDLAKAAKASKLGSAMSRATSATGKAFSSATAPIANAAAKTGKFVSGLSHSANPFVKAAMKPATNALKTGKFAFKAASKTAPWAAAALEVYDTYQRSKAAKRAIDEASKTGDTSIIDKHMDSRSWKNASTMDKIGRAGSAVGTFGASEVARLVEDSAMQTAALMQEKAAMRGGHNDLMSAYDKALWSTKKKVADDDKEDLESILDTIDEKKMNIDDVKAKQDFRWNPFRWFTEDYGEQQEMERKQRAASLRRDVTSLFAAIGDSPFLPKNAKKNLIEKFKSLVPLLMDNDENAKQWLHYAKRLCSKDAVTFHAAIEDAFSGDGSDVNRVAVDVVKNGLRIDDMTLKDLRKIGSGGADDPDSKTAETDRAAIDKAAEDAMDAADEPLVGALIAEDKPTGATVSSPNGISANTVASVVKKDTTPQTLSERLSAAMREKSADAAVFDDTNMVGGITDLNKISGQQANILAMIFGKMDKVIKAIDNHNTEIGDSMGEMAKGSFNLMKDYTNANFTKIDNTPKPPLSVGPAITVNK